MDVTQNDEKYSLACQNQRICLFLETSMEFCLQRDIVVIFYFVAVVATRVSVFPRSMSQSLHIRYHMKILCC